MRTECDICGWASRAGRPGEPSRPSPPTSTDSPFSVNASVEIRPLFRKYTYSMGRFGSDNCIPSGRSTGIKNFANAAYSSSGNCARMRLRGRTDKLGLIELRLVSNGNFLYAREILWPQRLVAHKTRGGLMRLA